MKKADTGKVKFLKDDMLIVIADIGLEMNCGYYAIQTKRVISKSFSYVYSIIDQEYDF